MLGGVSSSVYNKDSQEERKEKVLALAMVKILTTAHSLPLQAGPSTLPSPADSVGLSCLGGAKACGISHAQVHRPATPGPPGPCTLSPGTGTSLATCWSQDVPFPDIYTWTTHAPATAHTQEAKLLSGGFSQTSAAHPHVGSVSAVLRALSPQRPLWSWSVTPPHCQVSWSSASVLLVLTAPSLCVVILSWASSLEPTFLA